MPPSEERKSDAPTDHGILTTSMIKKDMVKNQVKDVRDDDDDTSILLIDVASSHESHGTNSITIDGSYISKVNLGDQDIHNCSILSDCFASHDSDAYDQLEQLELASASYNDDLENDSDSKGVLSNTVDLMNSNNKQMIDSHHQIVLYYNSKTVSSTKSLSLVEVRNRLKNNLQFIKDVKSLLGPFLDSNSKHFTIEYRDVADRGTFLYLTSLIISKQLSKYIIDFVFIQWKTEPDTSRLLQKQFGGEDGEGDEDGATVVTTSSLMVSLPAVVIDHRIMIPCSEPDWSTIVLDYMNLLLNLDKATVPDDASILSRVSFRLERDDAEIEDNKRYDEELDDYDLALHMENSTNDSSDEEKSERVCDFYATEQYYKESNRDLLGRENAVPNTTNSCSTANDSVESSVTQVTTNLTRRTTSSSRLQSLFELPFNDSSNDVSIRKEDSRSNQKKVKPVTPSNIVAPAQTIQFSSHDNPDLYDQTSLSTLSYTISNEVQRSKVVKAANDIPILIDSCTSKNVSEIPETKKGTNVATRVLGTVNHQPGQRLLTIPFTKQAITVADITRQLMHVTTHRYQYIPQSSSTKWQNAFRGFEGILIWKNTFGKEDMNAIKMKGKPTSTGDDDKWIEFGLLLLSHGILYDYTPNETNFRRAYLAVQPLRNTFAMNTLIQWSPVKHEKKDTFDCETGMISGVDDALSIVLRLSRSIDVMVERYTSNPTSISHLLDEYEEAVCQLQTISLPSQPNIKTVVVLNLYNMIIRHAMLLMLIKKRKGWTWPTSLEEMDLLLDKIGYIIDGRFVCASRLREYLLRGVDHFDCKESIIGRKIITHRSNIRTGNTCLMGRRRDIDNRSLASTMFGPSCMGGGATNRWKKGLVDEVDHYEAKYVLTDKRLLMAMTWGTSISPVVHTVYPDQFDKTLHEYAKQYCQKHVTVTYDMSSSGKIVTVALPSLFSWYRNDFGTYRENVLESIKQYLSQSDQDKIAEVHHSGKLRITYQAATSVNWMCNFATSEMLPDEDRSHYVHKVSAPKSPQEMSNDEQGAVVRSKKTLDSSRAIKEKDVKFPMEKDINWVQNISPIKEIVPGKRNKPSPLIYDTTSLYGIERTTSKKDCATSALLNPSIYLAHLTVTRNLLGEMGMEHSFSPSQIKSSHHDGKLPVTTTNTACRDIVINGLNHPCSDLTDDESIKCNRKKSFRPTPLSARHDFQTGLLPDKLRNPPLKHSTDDLTDQFFGKGSIHGSDDSVALIQQWIGLTHGEPTSSVQKSQGDSILMQAFEAPSSARQASLGDSMLLPPTGRTKPIPRPTPTNTEKTKIEYFLPTENRDPNILYDANRRFDDTENGGQSFTFRSDVSAITFGSDFDALLRTNSLPQLVHPATSTSTFTSTNNVRPIVQHPVASFTPKK